MSESRVQANYPKKKKNFSNYKTQKSHRRTVKFEDHCSGSKVRQFATSPLKTNLLMQIVKCLSLPAYYLNPHGMIKPNYRIMDTLRFPLTVVYTDNFNNLKPGHLTYSHNLNTLHEL